MSGIISASAEVKGQWESELSWCPSPPPEPAALERNLGNSYQKKKKKNNVSWVVIFFVCLPNPSEPLLGCCPV